MLDPKDIAKIIPEELISEIGRPISVGEFERFHGMEPSESIMDRIAKHHRSLSDIPNIALIHDEADIRDINQKIKGAAALLAELLDKLSPGDLT